MYSVLLCGWSAVLIPRRVSFRAISFAQRRSATCCSSALWALTHLRLYSPVTAMSTASHEKTRHSASFESRVFVIGARTRPGPPHSMSTSFTAMGLKSCHDTCPDKHGDARARCDRTNHEKNASSPLWSVYNAFSDHGDHADYKWLDTAFPGSRFVRVLNTRALQPWILSSYDHVRVHREMYNCMSQGDACRRAKVTAAQSGGAPHRC